MHRISKTTEKMSDWPVGGPKINFLEEKCPHEKDETWTKTLNHFLKEINLIPAMNWNYYEQRTNKTLLSGQAYQQNVYFPKSICESICGAMYFPSSSCPVFMICICSIGQPEETKRFDNTNYDVEKWIQVGYLKILKDWSILSKCHLRFWCCPEFWRTRKVEINLLHGQHPSERFYIVCDWTWFIGRDRLIQVHFHGIIMDELKRLYILSIRPYGTFCNKVANKKHMWVNLWCFIFSKDSEMLTVYRIKKKKEFGIPNFFS